MHVSYDRSSSSVVCFVVVIFKSLILLQLVRSLMHRSLTPFFPLLRLMGAVPGEPKSALSLLKSGFWVAVIPGNLF